MIKLLLCGFIAGIISVVLNSVVIGLIIGIALLTISASINAKNIAIAVKVTYIEYFSNFLSKCIFMISHLSIINIKIYINYSIT